MLHAAIVVSDMKERLKKVCFDENDEFFYDVDGTGKFRKFLGEHIFRLFVNGIVEQSDFDKIFDRSYYDMGYMLGPSIVDVATATVDIIHNTVFLNLNFKDLYNQSIVAFNERYSHRDFFSVEKPSDDE